MLASYSIDAAAASDAPGLIALRTGVVAEGEFLISEAGEFPASLDAVIARVRMTAPNGGPPNRCMFVARARFQTVGVIEVQPGAFRRNRHVGHIEVLVRADWRGKGVGRGLLERVLSWSANSAVTKLSLAVYAHNMPAIALYRSCGFTEEGRRVAEYRFPDGSFRDDLLMARTVGITPL
jgi:ribosomal protein S18 acetylase RimI-like enzyme